MLYLHPMVVHFPIALLTLYSIFEIISIRRLQEKQYWFYVKAIFVTLGELGAIASLITARFATYLIQGEPLVEAYEKFSYAAAIIFGIISILYALVWFGRQTLALRTAKYVFARPVMLPLAIAGLLLIYISGGLGGATIYGTNFDPLMQPVFRLLNIN